jgi:transcriptional regulator with PAS, ATPase and Fis domain
VLLQGESGTGKELFAQSIHNAGVFRSGPFVPINCAAIPRELIESELFGYAAGTFTGAVQGGRPGKLEVANRGTVFFDEIGDMPWDMQTKLLRVLQDNLVTRVGSVEGIAVDVRYIFATNLTLEEMVGAGRFRADLFYRINVFTLRLPPLRERRGDVPLLARSLADKISGRLGLPSVHLDEAVLEQLSSYSWPGNVRQLENVIERLILLGYGTKITADVLAEILPPVLSGSEYRPPGLLAEAEKQTIEKAVKRSGGNISEAARLIGISRKTLYVKMKKYGLKH